MRRYVHAVVLGTLVSMLLASQILPATAGDDLLQDTVDQVAGGTSDVVDDATDSVVGTVTGTTGTTSGATQTASAAAEESAGSSEDDHAAASVAELLIAGNDAVEIGSTSSTINEDGSTSSDVTVLALGGQEIVGSHADSNGTSESSNDALAPVCEGSGGQLCLGLLYAKASAHEDGKSSSADSDAAIAYVCAGGSSTDPEAECDGPADVGVAESHSTIERDKSTGSTSADAESDLVDACLGGRGADGSCAGVGVNALHSESHSDAPKQNAPGTASRKSYLLGISAGGQHQEILGDPQELSIPPGCPDDGAACVFLNQGETHIRVGGASANQDALHLVVKLPNIGELIDLRLGHTETSVTNPGPELPDGGDDVRGERVDRPEAKKRSRTVAAGNLPFTGGDLTGWIVVATLLVVMGIFAWSRKRIEG